MPARRYGAAQHTPARPRDSALGIRLGGEHAAHRMGMQALPLMRYVAGSRCRQTQTNQVATMGAGSGYRYGMVYRFRRLILALFIAVRIF
jgi:hypothetical protein